MSPRAPGTPCPSPGCPEITPPGKHCEQHEPPSGWNRWREVRAGERHDFYNRARWKKLSRSYRADHPICERCLERGETNPSELVHHIIPVERDGAKYDRDNLRALCETCHWRTHGLLADDVTLVCGPPGSGKTTYVRQRLSPGDLVVDVDTLWEALSGQPRYMKPDGLLDAVLKTRGFLLDYIASDTKCPNTAWVIAGAPEAGERERLARRTGADIVLLDVDAEMCKQRIREDDMRPAKARHLRLVDDWWGRYEPSEMDDAQQQEPEGSTDAPEPRVRAV